LDDSITEDVLQPVAYPTGQVEPADPGTDCADHRHIVQLFGLSAHLDFDGRFRRAQRRGAPADSPS
jgi:hypothetical protein